LPQTLRGSDELLLVSSLGFLGCDAIYGCGKISTFQRSMLPPSAGEMVGWEKMV